MFHRILLLIFVLLSLKINAEYTNPVMGRAPDPTVLNYKNTFYLYSTCTDRSPNVPIFTSKNLVEWSAAGNAFSNSTLSLFPKDWSVWAPDVIEYKGKFVMTYALSRMGVNMNNGIGVAVAENPLGPFDDEGLLFKSKDIGVKNSIDPSFFRNGKKMYLIWGSFHGIYSTELDFTNINDIKLKNPSKKEQLAGTLFEGSHIYKRGKYYYLFASVGTCCDGVNSTYQVVVGRSKRLEGPYVNRNGEYMLDNAFTPVIKGDKYFVGPGHGSTILTDKNGHTWYVFHAYEREAMSKGRQAMLVEIKWDKEGWPYVDKGVPCRSGESPVF